MLILCWIILAAASLSMTILGASKQLISFTHAPTSSINHFIQFLFIIFQTFLKDKPEGTNNYHFLLDRMVFHINTFTLQIGYK